MGLDRGLISLDRGGVGRTWEGGLLDFILHPLKSAMAHSLTPLTSGWRARCREVRDHRREAEGEKFSGETAQSYPRMERAWSGDPRMSSNATCQELGHSGPSPTLPPKVSSVFPQVRGPISQPDSPHSSNSTGTFPLSLPGCPSTHTHLSK